MNIPPIFIVMFAVLALTVVAIGMACCFGRKTQKKQAARIRDTERGIKISKPMLRPPPPVRNPDALTFVPTYKGERYPQPAHPPGWI
jgi:hypothetical protein